MIILFYILVTRGEKRSLRCLDSRRDGWMDGWRDDEGKFDFDEERHEGANLLIIIKIGGDESFEIHGDGWRERDRRERGKERTRWMFASGHFSLSNVEDEGWKRTRKWRKRKRRKKRKREKKGERDDTRTERFD